MENNQLTTEEIAIWETLSKGLTYKEIADNLDIPINAVQSRLKHIYRKLCVRNRAEAAIKFLAEQRENGHI